MTVEYGFQRKLIVTLIQGKLAEDGIGGAVVLDGCEKRNLGRHWQGVCASCVGTAFQGRLQGMSSVAVLSLGLDVVVCHVLRGLLASILPQPCEGVDARREQALTCDGEA